MAASRPIIENQFEFFDGFPGAVFEPGLPMM
jgi:hypothetical protein